MKQSVLFFTFALLFVANFSFGQTAMSRSLSQSLDQQKSGTEAIGAFGEVITLEGNDAAAKHVKNQLHFHCAKTLSNETGFFVQLIVSQEELSKEHPLFQEFGNVKLEIASNPKYCYLIGQFATEKGATDFLNKTIIERYPDAVIVSFKEGKRQ
jgi:hypothetical protein